MSDVIAIDLFLLVNYVSVESSRPLLASIWEARRECDTLKLACLSKMREEPSASIEEEGQEQILRSKVAHDGRREGGTCEEAGRTWESTGWYLGRLAGEVECLARVAGRQYGGGLLLWEGSEQNREDVDQRWKRISRTGGWKEKRFKRGHAKCREE